MNGALVIYDNTALVADAPQKSNIDTKNCHL